MQRVSGDWVEIYYTLRDLYTIDQVMLEYRQRSNATLQLCLMCVEEHGLTANLDLFAYDDGMQELNVVGICPRCGRIYGVGKWLIPRSLIREKRRMKKND